MATHWIILAIASGAFAALNGLFAKLTTTESTKNFASSIAHILPFLGEGFVEFLVRAACFGLNILCNVLMWALFTRALTVSPSTTKVSITNTSTNFLVTAVLGMIVFGEQVRGLWWVGAAMMGVGCILVGMREKEGENTKKKTHNQSRSARGEEPLDEDETITLIGEGE
ncbi:hypothetical protein VTN31DRAFT_2876 [Thermomyces dupontii]|uniref:uncharacterized protein n=1 Tax=Talaromyces thermophilus TaxID=28565 RepID=UPI0037435656